MLHDILKLNGVQQLKQNEKKSINGGNTTPCDFFCTGGLCIMGQCHYVVK